MMTQCPALYARCRQTNLASRTCRDLIEHAVACEAPTKIPATARALLPWMNVVAFRENDVHLTSHC